MKFFFSGGSNGGSSELKIRAMENLGTKAMKAIMLSLYLTTDCVSNDRLCMCNFSKKQNKEKFGDWEPPLHQYKHAGEYL